MTEVDFDNAEEAVKFEEGKRYPLVVTSAEDGESKTKGTPFLRLHLETTNGVKAEDATIWLSPKALPRAAEWFRALGLKDTGKVNYDASKLSGIKLTAECAYERNTVNAGLPTEKTFQNVRWVSPQRVAVGQQSPEQPPVEEVPF